MTVRVRQVFKFSSRDGDAFDPAEKPHPREVCKCNFANVVTIRFLTKARAFEIPKNSPCGAIFFSLPLSFKCSGLFSSGMEWDKWDLSTFFKWDGLETHRASSGIIPLIPLCAAPMCVWSMQCVVGECTLSVRVAIVCVVYSLIGDKT